MIFNGKRRIILVVALIIVLTVPTASAGAQPNQAPLKGLWPVQCGWGIPANWNGQVTFWGAVSFDVSWQARDGTSGVTNAIRWFYPGKVWGVVFTPYPDTRITFVKATGAIAWDVAFCVGIPTGPEPSSQLNIPPTTDSSPISIRTQPLKR